MTANPYYRTYAWRKLAEQRRKLAASNDEPCCRCGGDIDYTIRSGRHPQAATIDHLTPRALTPEQHHQPTIDQLGPAHRRCNSRHGGQVAQTLAAARKAASGAAQPRTTPAGMRNPTATARRSQARGGVFDHGEAAPAERVTVFVPDVTVSDRVVVSGPTDDDGMPRFMSRRHPMAVETLADEWIPWLESDAGGGIRLRPAQELVLRRALEVDAEGLPCWRTVVLSMSRQSGKSWGAARGVMTARCEFGPELWGEPQECLHVANALVAARRIQSKAWRWAESRGFDVRKSMGYERVIWPDESHWSLVATKSAWGASGSMVFVDEAWDIAPEVVDEGLEPTMLERAAPQLWLTSTANDAATDLMLGKRREALEGSGKVLILEWSTPPDVDVFDPAVWRRWAAHWSPQRQEFMAQLAERARRDPKALAALKSQHLNVWPQRVESGSQQWPAGWSQCPRVSGAPPVGGVACIESTVDRAHYGSAYAVESGGRVSVWTARHGSLEAAVSWVSARGPARVVVGLSLVQLVVVPWPVEGFGSSHTMLATPLLEDLVRRGMVAHDHGEAVGVQAGHARTVTGERGMYLSGKVSRGPVETLKAASWAVLGALQPAPAVAAIW